MNTPGRLREPLDRVINSELYGATAEADVKAFVEGRAVVDIAHVVMLAEQGIIDATVAVALIDAIKGLERDVTPLVGVSANRGLFWAYESFLETTIGSRAAGSLQTARSRNDVNATVALLSARDAWAQAMGGIVSLCSAVLAQVSPERMRVMPMYTHAQPAVPTTLEHWFLAWAAVLGRQMDLGLALASVFFVECPLGANSVGGTSMPINTQRTAAYLGFAQGPSNSIDAVASRDAAVQLVSWAAWIQTSLSRFARDLQTWTRPEIGFVSFPDRLVGSSSLMPQKRNPFVLEHVIGRAGRVVGGANAVLGATVGAPYTNAIEVGTEAVAASAEPLALCLSSLRMMTAIVEGIECDDARMLSAAAEHDQCATALAERLVLSAGVSYREAYNRVAEYVSKCDGDTDIEVAALAQAITPSEVAESCKFGGGPGGGAIGDRLLTRTTELQRVLASLEEWRARWASGANNLRAAVEALRARAEMHRV